MSEQTNPYGEYTSAPPPGLAPGQVMPGSLPYVEAHFGRVAHFGPRALAYLIDFALTLIGVVPVVAGAVMLIVSTIPATAHDSYDSTPVSQVNTGLLGAGILLMVVGGLLALAITIWNRIFRMGRTGQSIGKKVVGLKLINATTGAPVGAGMTFVRELLHGIINQVVYLSFLWMLWDPNRQTLADLVVKSAVIEVPKN